MSSRPTDGLQSSRTVLAWRRSVASAGAVVAIVAHHVVATGDVTAGQVAVLGASIVGAAAMMGAAVVRSVTLGGAVRPAGRVPITLSAVAVALSAGAALIEVALG